MVVATLEGDLHAWSPDGNRLAYARGTAIAVAMAPDFARECRVRVRDADAEIRQIAWSPDARHVALVSPRSTDQWDTIWLTSVDCDAVRDVLPPGAPVEAVGLRAVAITDWLSPHDIAFSQHCGTSCTALHTVNVERAAYGHLCVSDGDFHWAPNKTYAATDTHLGGLAIVSANSATPLTRSSNFSSCDPIISACEFTEGRSRGVWHTYEDWAPDGSAVVISTRPCEVADPAVGELVLWQIGSNHQDPLFSHAMRAAWSPNGDRIAFLLFGTPQIDASDGIVGSSLPANGPAAVHVAIANVATQHIDVLVPLGTAVLLGPPTAPRGLPERYPDEYRPLWSPDGRHLLVRDVRRNVLLISADGSGSSRLLGDVHASWSPDGRRLAMSDPSRHQVVVLHLRSETAR
jgi:hypothetical protein